ncbi:MAG TPA: DUF5996 family protein [Anaerolineales bacterium]
MSSPDASGTGSSAPQESQLPNDPALWPDLPYESWTDTRETLHMWTQVAGKVALALCPMQNHWWQIALHVTPRGLITPNIPYAGLSFTIEFDLAGHALNLADSAGRRLSFPLYPRSVADFYKELMSLLGKLGIRVQINTLPQEVPNPIPCDQDVLHCSYDKEYVDRFRRILVLTEQVFQAFRGPFLGKCSPVNFWWGSFDLAVTRFSGRLAPVRPGASLIDREAYSHECSSAGFWPGSGRVLEPAYYAYTVPAPAGIETYPVQPAAAAFNEQMGEFILPYASVRGSERPAEALMNFLQTTYEAGADLGNWDRLALERQPDKKSGII